MKLNMQGGGADTSRIKSDTKRGLEGVVGDDAVAKPALELRSIDHIHSQPRRYSTRDDAKLTTAHGFMMLLLMMKY